MYVNPRTGHDFIPEMETPSVAGLRDVTRAFQPDDTFGELGQTAPRRAPVRTGGPQFVYSKSSSSKSLGDLGLIDTVNPQKDFMDAAAAALGVNLPVPGYQLYSFGVGQQSARDAMRDERNAIGWSPAFEWSQNYGSWYQSGSGYRFGLVYRDADMPVEYQPVPQSPSQGGGYLIKLWKETVAQQADGSTVTVPAGAVIRTCSMVRTDIPGSPSVIGPAMLATLPCPEGTGGCAASSPCTVTTKPGVTAMALNPAMKMRVDYSRLAASVSRLQDRTPSRMLDEGASAPPLVASVSPNTQSDEGFKLDEGASAPPSASNTSNTLLWVSLGVGALVLFFALRSK